MFETWLHLICWLLCMRWTLLLKFVSSPHVRGVLSLSISLSFAVDGNGNLTEKQDVFLPASMA